MKTLIILAVYTFIILSALTGCAAHADWPDTMLHDFSITSNGCKPMPTIDGEGCM